MILKMTLKYVEVILLVALHHPQHNYQPHCLGSVSAERRLATRDREKRFCASRAETDFSVSWELLLHRLGSVPAERGPAAPGALRAGPACAAPAAAARR